MTSNFLNFKSKIVACLLCFITFTGFSQDDTSTWKLQFAVGANHPMGSDQNEGYGFKAVNFPSINLGLQYMFMGNLGAKVDFGYNRASDDGGNSEFKLNYSRVNAQAVYDFSEFIGFLPMQLRTVAHAGPGLSFSKPLGDFSDNTYTYLNVMAGLELHYGISRGVSVYGDVSYILGLSGSDKYNPQVDGFSFNGDVMTISVGISVSLSGCRYCK